MSKYGCIVMGPAGAGKTTFCSALIQHLRHQKRSCVYVNLDPAAEDFVYQPDVDIKTLVPLDEVMEEMDLGPNGGLMYCFDYLLQNMDSLIDPLYDLSEDYLVIIDMPGQIELYTHAPVVPQLVKTLTTTLSMRLCAAYLLESTFIMDRSKFFAGTLSAMSAMLLLELPHINILSKMDLMKGSGVSKRELRRYIDPSAELLDDDEDVPIDVTSTDFEINEQDPSAAGNVKGRTSFDRLNHVVAKLIDDFSMVSFLQLDVQNEESVDAVLSYIDDTIQFHEAQEPNEPADEMEADE